jgi:hypothetical protein
MLVLPAMRTTMTDFSGALRFGLASLAKSIRIGGRRV